MQKSDKNILTVGFKCKPFAIDHVGNKVASFFFNEFEKMMKFLCI